MALRSVVTTQSLAPYSRTLTCCLKPRVQSKERCRKVLQFYISRRVGTIAVVASLFLANEAILAPEPAKGLEFGMVVPEHSLEEAESGLRGHAQSLLEVKDLLDSEDWSEARKALRKSSSNLKQDFYTIIQSKPGSERPRLRILYSDLFNNVTKLDYAARDKDVPRVQQLYGKVVVALKDILSLI